MHHHGRTVKPLTLPAGRREPSFATGELEPPFHLGEPRFQIACTQTNTAQCEMRRRELRVEADCGPIVAFGLVISALAEQQLPRLWCAPG
jgi:hypothetical protein